MLCQCWLVDRQRAGDALFLGSEANIFAEQSQKPTIVHLLEAETSFP